MYKEQAYPRYLKVPVLGEGEGWGVLLCPNCSKPRITVPAQARGEIAHDCVCGNVWYEKVL